VPDRVQLPAITLQILLCKYINKYIFWYLMWVFFPLNALFQLLNALFLRCLVISLSITDHKLLRAKTRRTKTQPDFCGGVLDKQRIQPQNNERPTTWQGDLRSARGLESRHLCKHVSWYSVHLPLIETYSKVCYPSRSEAAPVRLGISIKRFIYIDAQAKQPRN